MRCCVNVVYLRILSRHIQLSGMRKHVALLTDFACALLSPPTERSELEEIMRLVDLSVVVLCVSVCLRTRIGGDMQWRIYDLAKWGHGERGKREPITAVWGGARSGVQGQSPWSGGQRAKPP